MKYIIISFLAFLAACASNPTNPANTGHRKTYLHAYDFTRNSFFLDTTYEGIYNEYYQNAVPVLPPNASKLRIKEIEVWKSYVSMIDTLVPRNRVLFADLMSMKMSMDEKYPDSMKQAGNQAGIIYRGTLNKLDSSQYKIDYNLGIITFNNFDSSKYYAVAYRTEGPTLSADDDDFTGTLTSAGYSLNDTLILKMINCPGMQSAYTSLWERKVMNIYKFDTKYIDVNKTTVKFCYISQNNDTLETLDSLPDKLISIFGFDRFDTLGIQQPDGLFDMQLPFFDKTAGEIKFPWTQPFIDGIKQYFFSINRRDLIQYYTFGEVYYAPHDVAASDKEKDRYLIIIETW